MSAHDEHIRAQVAELGQQCFLALMYERVCLAKGDFEMAAQLADAAEWCSREAFSAVRS